MAGQDVQEVLVRVVEDDFIILPRMHGPGLDGDVQRWDLGITTCCPWMKLEVVVQCHSFLAGFLHEGDAYLNLELAPSELM